MVNGVYFIEPGTAWGPEAPSWTWDQGTDMYGTAISGAERLENGNTLVTWGQRGTFYEVNHEGEIVWEYINPVINDGIVVQGESVPTTQNGQRNPVFRATRIEPTHSALSGRELMPQGYIETSP